MSRDYTVDQTMPKINALPGLLSAELLKSTKFFASHCFKPAAPMKHDREC